MSDRPPTTGLDLRDAAWQTFTIPGSDRPVELARLGADPDGGFNVVVRFPTGWTRPGPGHYDAIEEVLFLAGRFEMSGQVYQAGDYGWFPSWYTRTASHAPNGALALAWFSGANRWFEGESPSAPQAAVDAVATRWVDQERVPSPLGPAGWPLRRADGRESWILESVPEATALPSTVARVDLFDLAGHRWHGGAAGPDLPVAVPGPVWARIVWR